MTSTKEIQKLSRHQKRMFMVQILYEYELFDKALISNEIFSNYEIGNFENKIFTSLEKNYFLIKSMINKLLKKNWSWNRLSPLLRSILLLSSTEIYNIDKPIIIDEYVKLTKDFIPGDSYKFVNSILENIDDFYEKMKEDNKKR